MSTYLKIVAFIFLCSSAGFISCKKYLEKTPSADISEEQVFQTFNNFQGFVETMYDDVIDLTHTGNDWGDFNYGDDVIPTRNIGWIEGNYLGYVIGSNRTVFYDTRAIRASGTWSNGNIRYQAYWQNGWYGIRAANLCLEHLNDLVDATAEQKQLIEGQAYYFRAYFHWEIMRAWGDIPYIDKVLGPNDDMRLPQLGFYVTVEKVLADFQKAIDLLPVDWDNTIVGKATEGNNWQRITKGMALAMMSECLLYSSSPLMNGTVTGNYIYNVDYAKRAAEAAWKVIELANSGLYALEPWETYGDIFKRLDGTVPRSRETIIGNPQRGDARWFPSVFTWGWLGVDDYYTAPTQNYVELFEMTNGLPIDDPESGFDAMKPWDDRDPRFYYNILLDGERQIKSLNDDRAFAQLYIGGRERTATTSLTGYGQKKYWDVTVNKFDNGWNKYYYGVPRIRLAEIYLFYAEAVNEAYGPLGKNPQADLTAVDAVNIVRARALMPNVNSKFLTSKEVFRERIWNERAIELALENRRWYDLRRWHVAHLLKYRELYALEFDKDHTYFKRVLNRTIDFNDRNYWLPFPTKQASLYPELKQNPGW